MVGDSLFSVYGKFKHYRQPVFSPPNQPSFGLVLVCTRPERVQPKEAGDAGAEMFPFLTSAEESGPRARGCKASLWPGWLSRRNKKGRTQQTAAS